MRGDKGLRGAARRIVAVPSSIGELLGLAGFRGSLRARLTIPPPSPPFGYGALGQPPRWFILCGDPEPAALAFAEFDGYVEHSRADLHPRATDERRHIREVLVHGAAARSVIDVPSILRAVELKVGQRAPQSAARAEEPARTAKESPR